MRRMIPALVASALAAGCAQLQSAMSSRESDWEKSLYYARAAVDARNYFAAEKLLDEYVRTHPATREASEIAFWKAAYIVDPANERGSLSDGITRLDAYLAANPNGAYRDEATVLRRTAAAAMAVTNPARATGADTLAGAVARDTVVIVKSREEEIASLREQLAKSKEELAKVSAELERIKKRLANPTG